MCFRGLVGARQVRRVVHNGDAGRRRRGQRAYAGVSGRALGSQHVCLCIPNIELVVPPRCMSTFLYLLGDCYFRPAQFYFRL